MLNPLNHHIYFIGPVVTESLYRDRVTKTNYYPFKIGVSSNVSNRLKQLQTASFVELEVILLIGPYTRDYAYKIEKQLHKELCNVNSIGEWFQLTYNLISYIDKGVNNIVNVNITSLTDRILVPIETNLYKELASQVYKFRWNCWNMIKDKENITYKSFWSMIDTTEYYPMKRTDRLAIILEEFKAKGITDIINNN